MMRRLLSLFLTLCVGCQLLDPNLRILSRDYGGNTVPNQHGIDFSSELTDEKLSGAAEHLRQYRVRNLSLADTAITDRSVPTILTIKTIQKLSIAGTHISYRGVAEIMHHRSLRTLVISEGQFEDRQLETLRALNPAVTIRESTVYKPRGLAPRAI